MAIMPGVHYNPVVGPGYPTMKRYDILCIHTIVGYAANGTAAHWTTNASGHIVQCRDTIYQSAANYHGNHRVLAIENEDFGPTFGAWSGSNVPPFTPLQVESLARICVWAHQTHGIPLILAPDSRSTSRGIAYHRQGIDGNFTGPYLGRVSGGELWSRAFGKVCPGDRRIDQVINQIIPRANSILRGDEDIVSGGVILPRTTSTDPFKTSFPNPYPHKNTKLFVGHGFGGQMTGRIWAWKDGHVLAFQGTLNIGMDDPGTFIAPAGTVGFSVEYTCPEDSYVTFLPL